MKYPINRIAEILDRPLPGFPLHSISILLTDSRSLTYPAESLFFALRTQNNDGHRYIKELIEKGVRNFVVDNIPAEVTGTPDVNFLVVPDVMQALHKVARHHRMQYDLSLIHI